MHILFFLGLLQPHLNVFQFVILQKVWCLGCFNDISDISGDSPQERKIPCHPTKQTTCKFLPIRSPTKIHPTKPPPPHLSGSVPTSSALPKNRVASRRPSAVPTVPKRVLQTNVCAMPAVPWPDRGRRAGLGFPHKRLGGWTSHPGRWTAGSPTAITEIWKRKMIWTKPPGGLMFQPFIFQGKQ